MQNSKFLFVKGWINEYLIKPFKRKVIEEVKTKLGECLYINHNVEVPEV